jgi:hypothetical protein
MPLSPARRAGPTGIQSFRNGSVHPCARRLNLADDRKNVRGERVRLGALGGGTPQRKEHTRSFVPGADLRRFR